MRIDADESIIFYDNSVLWNKQPAEKMKKFRLTACGKAAWIGEASDVAK